MLFLLEMSHWYADNKFIVESIKWPYVSVPYLKKCLMPVVRILRWMFGTGLCYVRTAIPQIKCFSIGKEVLPIHELPLCLTRQLSQTTKMEQMHVQKCQKLNEPLITLYFILTVFMALITNRLSHSIKINEMFSSSPDGLVCILDFGEFYKIHIYMVFGRVWT